MLKDVVIELTKNYHELGHHGSSVDAMMDSVAGMGHRIKHGHDMQGMIEAYDLQGVEGIGLWFDHMTKDFTSPAGIPLPFAEAVYQVSDMSMNTAIDWLTVNAFDAGSLITQEIALKLFKDNKKAYQLTFLFGSAIGIIDDNPLIVVINTLRILKAGKLQRLMTEKQMDFIGRTGSITSKACMGTAVVTLGAGAIGINLSAIIESGGEWMDVTEVASILSDLLDGVSTFGLALFASKGMKFISDSFNGELQNKVMDTEGKLAMFRSLRHQVVNGASPARIAFLLEEMEDQNILKGVKQ